MTEIEKAIRRASPNKAPDVDGITNDILHETLDILLPSLHKLFNVYLQLGYYPIHFKETVTVVLRKLGKDDYSQPKAYRPIALLKILGKAMEAIVTNRLAYLVDVHYLLVIGMMCLAGGTRDIGRRCTRVGQGDTRLLSLVLLVVAWSNPTRGLTTYASS